MNEAIRMQLSAFVDGELPENEKELLLRRLSQDAGLRQQVAEYLAIGHAIRGEVQIGGANGVRERVAGALGDRLLDELPADTNAGGRRMLKPLMGFAVAASVALVAILGLRQTASVDGTEVPAAAVAETAEFPTQPEADELLRQYRLLHDAGASDNGAHSIRTRLTGFELRRVTAPVDADAEIVAPADGDEAAEADPAAE